LGAAMAPARDERSGRGGAGQEKIPPERDEEGKGCECSGQC